MKRHRNHVLEDLSLTALKQALPDFWVVHSYFTDYGIDVQIEIFEENGDSTGLRVYGQVKATDKSEGADVLQLDRDHFEYWAQHTDPVALFRYYSESGTIKWCWMHDLEWRMRPSASSLNVCSHLRTWRDTTSASEILQLVQIRSSALHQHLPPPISISVRSAQGGIAESLKFAECLTERLPAPQFEVLGEATSPCYFEVILDNRRICIGHLGLPGYVATIEEINTPDEIANYALLLLFLVAARYDRTLFLRGAAPKVLQTMWSVTDDILMSHAIEGLMGTMGIDRAIPAILEHAPSPELPLLWFVLMAAGTRSSHRYGEMESWRLQLKNWADRPIFSAMAATAAYNYANHLANAGAAQWDEAEEYYLLAGRRDPTYHDRDYYWDELGATQFEAEKYDSAVASYQKSLDISQSAATRWRLGDALFHNGQYEAAYTAIKDAIASGEDFGLYPLLVMELCGELLSRWHITQQLIIPVGEEDIRRLSELKPSKTEVNLIVELKPFIDLCAIDPRLSFNSGQLAIESKQPQVATYRFLTCALRQRNDAEAWALALGTAIQAEFNELVALIMQSAYFYAGEDFIVSVMKTLSLPDGVQDATKSEFGQQLIELIRSTKTKKPQSFVMRVFGGEKPTVLQGTIDGLK